MVIEDLVRGRIVVKDSELDDLIIARSDGSPTYNISVVVDDLDMKVTRIERVSICRLDIRLAPLFR